MTKWISDGSIIVKEAQNTRSEQHNSISGMPMFNVRLEIPTAQLKPALARLLGIPEAWPHDTILQNVKAVSANIVVHTGESTTDGDGVICLYSDPTLVDMTYSLRTGMYVIDDGGNDVYWEDTIEPSAEYRPENHLNFIWGNTTNTVPNDKDRTLSPDGVPSKFEPAETLTHTVEGWPFVTEGLELFIGTVNFDFYQSPILDRTFNSGTLLLKSIQISKGISFISYREPFGSPVFPLREMSGKMTPTLKFIYQYKKNGWDRFWRADSDTANYPSGYYYIRHRDPPHAKYDPFPPADHSKWLNRVFP